MLSSPRSNVTSGAKSATTDTSVAAVSTVTITVDRISSLLALRVSVVYAGELQMWTYLFYGRFTAALTG
ncbi:MAG: hypothetical protein VYA99_10140 [Pseudomonadota bacterium]|nr:hypothetical protein [Pseudomonadota bacterium]